MKIKNNNVILAIPSSGLHSNGFSLISYLFKKKKIDVKKSNFKNLELKKELLKPTKIYVKEVLNLCDRQLVNCCANITGGGLIENLSRVIPRGLQANIYLEKIKVLKIFKWLKEKSISENEMLKTFNCGIGFCLIVQKKNIHRVNSFFSKKYKPYVIGHISKGSNKIKKYGKIDWKQN